jgi:putative NIF3 family GTP cyclohydrolase 1 type 2
VTGELDHHAVLAAVAAGAAVVLTRHSASERGFLPVVAERLRAALASEAEGGGAAIDFQVCVSETDADPLVFA